VVCGFLQLIRPVVLKSASGGGCAVAAMTRPGPDHDGPQQAAAVAIGSWISELAGRFAAAGLAAHALTALTESRYGR
jgi:hypothetical protein